MNLALALLVGVPLLTIVTVGSIIWFHEPTTTKVAIYIDQCILNFSKKILSDVKINKQTMSEIKALYPTVGAGKYYKLKERYAAIERRNQACRNLVEVYTKYAGYQERTIDTNGFGVNIKVLVHPNHIQTFDGGDYRSIQDYILVME